MLRRMLLTPVVVVLTVVLFVAFFREESRNLSRLRLSLKMLLFQTF